MSKTHQNLPRIFMSKYGNQELRTSIWKEQGFGKDNPLGTPIFMTCFSIRG